jgi:hypothetical protein
VARKYDIVPVDQGHSFGPPGWDATLAADLAISIASPVTAVVAAQVQPFVARLDLFDANDAAELVKQVPAAWLTAAERDAVETYLTARAGPTAAALRVQFP